MKSVIIYILFVFLLGGGNKYRTLEKYLGENLKNYDDFSFQVVGKMPDFKIDASRKFVRKGKFGYVPVVEKKTKKSYLTVKLKLFQKCFVAKENISPRIKLSREMFDYVKVDVSPFLKSPVKAEFSFKNYRAKKMIRKGGILFREDVETVPLIESGMPVKAKFVEGNVVIEFRAVARQDGWKNQIIKIKTKKNKTYSAKVLDKNNVLITE